MFVSDLIELNMQQGMQFRYILTIDKKVTLVEMQDFYLKKRKRDAVLNNVI